MKRDLDDALGSQFEIMRKVVRKYQPWVRLSALGREKISNGKCWRGRLVGINERGALRVRKENQARTASYFPSFWEFDPDQTTPEIKEAG